MWVESSNHQEEFTSKIGPFPSNAAELVGVYFMKSYSDLFVTESNLFVT